MARGSETMMGGMTGINVFALAVFTLSACAALFFSFMFLSLEVYFLKILDLALTVCFAALAVFALKRIRRKPNA